jgi:hypothetical protein
MTRRPARDREPEYPFVPKSNAHLRAGQFWTIPLAHGRFAAGVVVATPDRERAPDVILNARCFASGVLDWIGDAEPTADDLGSAQLIAWGTAHIRSIVFAGGSILGRSDHLAHLDPDDRILSPEPGSPVYRNGEFLRDGTDEDAEVLPSLGTWGLRYATSLAEARLTSHRDD